MATNPEKEQVSYVHTDAMTLYPAEDGKLMAASDLHRHQRSVSTISADGF